MTKKELVDLINKFNDDAIVCLGFDTSTLGFYKTEKDAVKYRNEIGQIELPTEYDYDGSRRQA